MTGPIVIENEWGSVRDHLADPREVIIFCHGEETIATFDFTDRAWHCARCGAKVTVAW